MVASLLSWSDIIKPTTHSKFYQCPTFDLPRAPKAVTSTTPSSGNTSTAMSSLSNLSQTLCDNWLTSLPELKIALILVPLLNTMFNSGHLDKLSSLIKKTMGADISSSCSY
jgi:hypothetical protein